MSAALARCAPYAWKAILVVAVGGAGLWTAMHGVAGVRWSEVADVLRGVLPWRLVALAAIWLGGLGIYSVVISAALPGLGVRRSLVLNLSGSAVANVVPLGGAVATALNWRMVRAWGHSDRAFVAFCVLTNALDVLTKLLLPLVAVVTLVALSVRVPLELWVVAAGCSAVLLIAVLVRATALRPRAVGSHADSRWHWAGWGRLRESDAQIRALLVDRWPRLLPASLGYVAAQVMLLLFSLRAVGLEAPLTLVLAAAAIERLGSLLPLTPGGTGVAEVGTIAWLVASGVDPVKAVAGVLLYRVFLVAMEIPVGSVLLVGWAWAHRSPAGGCTQEVTA